MGTRHCRSASGSASTSLPPRALPFASSLPAALDRSRAMRTGCAILAAGASRRLGFPKQLVELCGEPLVRRAVNSALRSGAAATAVVVGAHAPAVREVLRPVQVVTLDN